MQRSLSLACLLIALSASGEMFVGPSSDTNRLLIAEKEAIMIHTIAPNGKFPRLVVSNISFTLPWTSRAEIFKIYRGPAELILPSGILIHFTRMANAAVGSLGYSPGWTNTVVDVPRGKTFQLFSAAVGSTTWYGKRVLSVKLSHPSGASFDSELFEGDTLEGPLTIEVPLSIYWSAETTNRYIATYWIMDDVFSNPGIITPRATTPLLFVEKSGDLTNWQTVGTIKETLSSNSFYRVRVGRNTSSAVENK